GMRHELAVASAQVKTALLLAGLQAEGASEVTEPALSRDHTERLLPAMGAPLRAVPGGVRVEPAAGGLTAIDLAVPGDPSAAAFASGTTEVADAAELRVKESDRIGTVAQELSQLGISVEARADGLVIAGGRPRAGLLKSHGDHRIAMAAAIAANACDGPSTVR